MSVLYIKNRVIEISPSSLSIWNEVILLVYGFHLSGNMNAQNFHVWSATNPHQYVENTLYTARISMWCAISQKEM